MASTNIVWNESIVLHAHDGLYSADCVLLQVTDKFRKNTTEEKMGEVVIPLSAFFTETLVSGLCNFPSFSSQLVQSGMLFVIIRR